MLLPALASAKERAKRIHCVNNLHQIVPRHHHGYTGDFADKVPPAEFVDSQTDNTDVSYNAYDGGLTANYATNLGVLWESKHISNPKLFYCLSGSNLKAGSAAYLQQRIYENYCNAQGIWPAYLPGDTATRVRTGYTYIPQSGTRTLPGTHHARRQSRHHRPLRMAIKGQELTGNYAILTDLILPRSTWLLIAAPMAAATALNALFGDMHINFEHNPTYFDTVNVWNDNVNGTTTSIEDKGSNFRWLIKTLAP